jgi:NitT/TauT family transport system ATP-binding protein
MTLLQGRERTPVQVVDSGPAVAVHGLTKRFGAAPNVLEDVSLEVQQGEFLCILGASGCGKSTLLSLVADLDHPPSGSVEVHGGKPTQKFQEPALFPWLTAQQNVELALRLRGVGKAERRDRAQELLGLVRLSDAGKKRVHELSGGMRQRVAMARALAQDSHVLLMDEPFAALDAITRDVLHEELVRIRESQKLTVLFVTHNVREAVRLGDRVVLLSSRPGRIVKEYDVDIPQPRRIESPQVAALSVDITDDLRREIRRHGGQS